MENPARNERHATQPDYKKQSPTALKIADFRLQIEGGIQTAVRMFNQIEIDGLTQIAD